MKQSNDKKNRAMQGVFTACAPALSLLETTTEAAKTAMAGVGILLSPACSSFDRFQNLQQRDGRICRLVKSISWGGVAASPKLHGENDGGMNRSREQKWK
jgi:UDP-N-acetylmuramoylalanine-D-glutamate ligase